MSHHEQFAWMERKLSIKLKENLPVWSRFIEIFERRNLLTHTGGIVSAQYIANGKDHKFDISNLKVGEKLAVDSKYFSEALIIIYEVGVKLCYVLWRRFAKEERDKADTILNNLCYDLMYREVYKLAESLLSFAAQVIEKHGGHEHTRRMIVINLANAVRLQKRDEEAKKIIDGEDWSATSNDLKIGAAAVKGDIAQVVNLMKQIGDDATLNAEAYRTWPIFRGIKNDKEFMAVFESIFGEPLILDSTVEVAASIKLSTTNGSTSIN